MFEDDFKSDKSLYYVCDDEGVITSYVALQIILDEATIMSIATKDEFRKKGFAQKLLDETFERLNEKEIKKIFLEVRSENKSAIALYEKNNFKQMSVRHNYYKEPLDDAIIMVKDL
ncbi:MAG: ribosomal protein S18-alanine N-acetyltransferase [Clostridia bacterium]|nr:ribosomal protein S18-alanine N-acetyltransferase [Clostridia bacterium]